MARKEVERVGFTQLCPAGTCIKDQIDKKAKREIQASRALAEAAGSTSRALCLNL